MIRTAKGWSRDRWTEYIRKEVAKGSYSAIVYIDGSTVYAEDAEGKTIAQGEAGVDDASVIQSALDGGGRIFLDGEFTINKALKISQRYLNLIGRYGTTIEQTADDDAILIEPADTNLIDVLIEKIIIKGSGKTCGYTKQNGIHLKTTGYIISYSKIRDVDIVSVGNHGIFAEKVDSPIFCNELERVRAEYCGGYGVFWGETTSSNLISILANNNSYGVHISGGHCNLIKVNADINDNNGIEVKWTGNISLINCHTEANQNYGLHIHSAPRTTVINHTFSAGNTNADLALTSLGDYEVTLINTKGGKVISQGQKVVCLGGCSFETMIDFVPVTSAKGIANSGTATFDGDGTTTQFTIAHGLVSTPSNVQITPRSADAAGDFYVTVDDTNIYVNYSSAPPSGSDNVVLGWEAEV